MGRRHLSAGEAFDVLRRASQRLNQKLVDVAERFAETGELPPSADRASGCRPASRLAVASPCAAAATPTPEPRAGSPYICRPPPAPTSPHGSPRGSPRTGHPAAQASRVERPTLPSSRAGRTGSFRTGAGPTRAAPGRRRPWHRTPSGRRRRRRSSLPWSSRSPRAAVSGPHDDSRRCDQRAAGVVAPDPGAPQATGGVTFEVAGPARAPRSPRWSLCRGGVEVDVRDLPQVSVEVMESPCVYESEVLCLCCLCTVGDGGVNQVVDCGSGVGADGQNGLHPPAGVRDGPVGEVQRNRARCAAGPVRGR